MKNVFKTIFSSLNKCVRWLLNLFLLLLTPINNIFVKHIFKINTSPHRYVKLFLSFLPFVLTIVLYFYVSIERRKENPNDKAMPRISEMVSKIQKFTFSAKIENQFDQDGNMTIYTGPKSFGEAYDQGGLPAMWDFFQKGESQIWKDTMATSYRFFIAMIFIFLSVFVGLFMGSFPYIESFLYKYVLFFDKIPTLVLTPILFIFVTAGNPAIITLIVLAVAPTIILDTYLKVKEVPKEQTIKGMTLKASTLENIFRITYVQIIPKVYDTIRLNFKSVINMLLVGELLGAEAGLGYRIFLVKRFMDMATIIPYIIYLGMFIYFLDLWVQQYIKKNYVWLNK